MTFIYFIQGVDGGPIKIGLSGNPTARLRTLQRTSPVVLEILCAVPGDRSLEAFFHDQFAIGRLHGEWFSEDTPALDRLIETIIAPDLSLPDVANLHHALEAIYERAAA